MTATPQTAAAGGRTSTAAGDEIARFDRIAQEWWDLDGDFRALHRLNPLRVGYIRDVLSSHFGRDPEAERPLDGLAVIDIGCGGGLVAEAVARMGAEVLGIDASPESVGVAECHARGGDLGIRYRLAAPEDLLDEGARFDVVLALEVIEHVADLDRFLLAAAELLRPDGAMVLSTINRTLKSLALAKVGAEYVLRWVPAGTHDWRKFVKPSELAASLRRAGLTVGDLRGLTYDPLRDTWALSPDLDVNYMAFAR